MNDTPNYTAVKDSGKREEFSTGAKRDTAEGKGRYDLLPTYAIHRLARHFENGAVKYGDENWRKGIPLRRFLDSAIRHAMRYLEGHRDEDHAAAAAWNILALIETEEMIRRGILPPELNNLPNWTEREQPATPFEDGDLQTPNLPPSNYDGYWNYSSQGPLCWRIKGYDVSFVEDDGHEIPSDFSLRHLVNLIDTGVLVCNQWPIPGQGGK